MRSIAILLLSVILFACTSNSFSGSYENLVEIKQYPDRVRIEKDGKIHFSLIQGDYKNNGSRAMMREKLPSGLDYDKWTYYKFGIDLGSGWPVHKKHQDALLVQWRNGWGRPLFSIHLAGDTFVIKRSSKPPLKYPVKADIDDTNEFLINAYWSEKDDGRLVVSVNGKIVLNYSGPTLKPTGVHPHLAFGLYRPQWNGKRFDSSNRISIIFSDVAFGNLDNSSRGKYDLSVLQ